MIKQFTISKNEKAEGKQPQYLMKSKLEDGKTINIASLWLREAPGAIGSKFFSGLMRNEFKKDDGTVYDGYVIISEKEYNELLSLKRQSDPELIAMHAKVNAPKNDDEDVNPDDIPF